MRKEITDKEMVRYFSGNCTEPEKKEMDNWRYLSGKNSRLFEEYQAMWEKSKQEIPEFDTEGALKKVTSRLDASGDMDYVKNTGYYVRRRYLKYAITIAAGIAILIGAYFGYIRIKHGKSLEYITLNTGSNEIIELTLNDGSRVWINAFSSFIYPRKFSHTERKVTFIGEAYFEIQKDTKRAFIIETMHSSIKVLGTAFHVRAVEREETEILTVTEGWVSFSNLKNRKESQQIAAGEQCVFHKRTNQLEKIKTDDRNFDAWKTKRIEFRSATINEVARTLSNYFNTTIGIEDETLGQMRFTSTFYDPQLSEVLKVIELTDKISITQEEDKYLLRKKEYKP